MFDSCDSWGWELGAVIAGSGSHMRMAGVLSWCHGSATVELMLLGSPELMHRWGAMVTDSLESSGASQKPG